MFENGVQENRFQFTVCNSTTGKYSLLANTEKTQPSNLQFEVSLTSEKPSGAGEVLVFCGSSSESLMGIL